MKRLSITLAAAALATTLLSGSPAWATDGSTAVDMCKRLAQCVYDVGPRGDILILPASGHIISCASPTAECEVTVRPDKVGTQPQSGNAYQPPQSLVETGADSGEGDAPSAPPPAGSGSGPIL